MPLLDTVSVEPLRKAQPSLRERKFARTKLALLQALMTRLGTQSLAEVTVKELCEEAEVSEATFFNYFPRKEDLLHYFVRLWMLEVSWHANQVVGAGAGLDYVDYLFRDTAERIAATPQVMREIIAKIALHEKPPGCLQEDAALTLAERLQAFPDYSDIEALPELELVDLFARPVARAVENGELPPDTNVEDVVVALVSIFFGVPLWFCGREPGQVAVHYDRQLKALWARHRL